MSISIIIPAYNAADTITDCLLSVAAQSHRAYEILVIDDCSDDDTADIASKLGAVVVRCEDRGGPAKARNIGAETAAGEIVLFLDADVIVPHDLLESILCIFDSRPEIAAVQTLYSPECTADNIVSVYQNLYYHYALVHVKKESVAIFATWCVAVRKKDFDGVGGFNTKIPEPTVEDEELGYSLVDSGRSIFLAKDILVVHLAAYTLCQFTRRRFRMAEAQAKSGWRSIRERLLKRYINLRETGTHHSRWVVLSILFVLFAGSSMLAFLTGTILGLSLLSWLPASALVAIFLSLLCHVNFFRCAVSYFGLKVLPGFILLCLIDMAILGWGVIMGSVLFLSGRHY